MKLLFKIIVLIALCNTLGAIEEKGPQSFDPSAERMGKGIFTEPGIIGYRNGEWIGTDHLFNLSSEIGISVEIVKPSKVELSITNDEIAQATMKIFTKGGLTPHIEKGGPDSPLPFFHFLIMIYPVQNGYIGCIDGRLFEDIDLERVKLGTGIFWQAITWEKQNLIIASRDDFVNQLNKNIDEIAEAFVERYKHFETIRSKQQGNKSNSK